MLKAGVFKTMSKKVDHNGALQWTRRKWEKITYFIEGAGKKLREGVKITTYDGKLQSMMLFKLPVK